MRSGASAAQSHAEPLLQVRDLSIDLVRSRNTAVSAVSEASFEIPRASIVALFGESGCGKTTLAMAVPRLLDERRYRVRGRVLLNGHNLIELREREMERIRGAGIGFVFQDPGLALNPVLRIRRQVAEALRGGPATQPGDGGVEAALALAGLAASPRIADSYPHQLSGGERQRVLIALALARRPALAIADEPFSALDAPRAAALCALFDSIRRETGTSFLVIDHHPGQLARIADSALVMYGGQIVERGPFGELMETPLHPYTTALVRLSRGSGDPVPGNPPGLSERPPGCPFEPRCREREARCASARPPEVLREKGRAVRCFKYAC